MVAKNLLRDWGCCQSRDMLEGQIELSIDESKRLQRAWLSSLLCVLRVRYLYVGLWLRWRAGFYLWCAVVNPRCPLQQLPTIPMLKAVVVEVFDCCAFYFLLSIRRRLRLRMPRGPYEGSRKRASRNHEFVSVPDIRWLAVAEEKENLLSAWLWFHGLYGSADGRTATRVNVYCR